jgi:hypothetical protein
MRAIEAEKPEAARRVEKSGQADALKGFIVALMTPRTAIAATAVLVLAASFAFIILRQPQMSLDQQARSSEPVQQAEAQPAAPPSFVAPQSEPAASNAQPERFVAKAGRADKEDESKAAEEKNEAASAPPPAAPKEQPAKPGEEDKAKTDEQPRKSETEKPAAAPPPPATEEKPLEKIDGARSVPTDDKDARSRVSTLRPGVVDGEATEGGKEKKVIRPDDAVARGEAKSSGGTAGRIASPPAGSSLRDPKDEVKSRPKGTPEFRIGGKKFYFLNNTWTDKDYNPEKEMPVVPVVRGSTLYKELLTKNAGLKIYFESDRFSEERAIIVYKKTVYKLSPPEK